MPTARQKILSTSWNVQFVAFNTSEKLNNNLVNAWMATEANCKPDLPLSRHLRSTGTIWWILLVCCWIFVCIGCFCTSYIVSNHIFDTDHCKQIEGRCQFSPRYLFLIDCFLNEFEPDLPLSRHLRSTGTMILSANWRSP
jgi:hypothetical protein